MIVITGLLIIGIGNLNTYRLINIMWIYALIIKMSNIVGWKKLGVEERLNLQSNVGVWNGIIKISSNELIIGLVLIILGGISQIGVSSLRQPIEGGPRSSGRVEDRGQRKRMSKLVQCFQPGESHRGSTKVLRAWEVQGSWAKSTIANGCGWEGEMRHRSEGVRGEIILLIIIGMWMTVISKEWISIILSIELQSNGIYLLVCKKSIASGLRYNIIGGISSSIMMISLLRIYSESGLSNIEEIKIWKEWYGGGRTNPEAQELGIPFAQSYVRPEYGVILGILIKMGTAPMHNWISDVMENISVEENKWVGGISKIPLIKIISEWGGKEIIPIILTLAIGGILGSTAYRIKKFIAYSGIHNLGYVLIIGGNNEKWLFFITQYVITLISILMVYKENVTIWSISELNKENKWVGITITISMLSSIGIPPLIGFNGKLSIIEWGLENGWGIITVIIIMGSVLSARNYIRVIRNTWRETKPGEHRGGLGGGSISLSVLVSLMVSNMVERYTQCI